MEPDGGCTAQCETTRIHQRVRAHVSVPASLRSRILVVEDAPALLDLFRDALDPAGFEVDTAATATEALNRLATRRYAVWQSATV